MALLKLPLSLLPSGVFERPAPDENGVGPRLKIFLLSGMTDTPVLASTGIRAFCRYLYSMGASSRFKYFMDMENIVALEDAILKEANNWLEGNSTIEEVELLGDEERDNALVFKTRSHEFAFTLKYVTPGHGHASVGPWEIVEGSHGIL